MLYTRDELLAVFDGTPLKGTSRKRVRDTNYRRYQARRENRLMHRERDRRPRYWKGPVVRCAGCARNAGHKGPDSVLNCTRYEARAVAA